MQQLYRPQTHRHLPNRASKHLVLKLPFYKVALWCPSVWVPSAVHLAAIESAVKPMENGTWWPCFTVFPKHKEKNRGHWKSESQLYSFLCPRPQTTAHCHEAVVFLKGAWVVMCKYEHPIWLLHSSSSTVTQIVFESEQFIQDHSVFPAWANSVCSRRGWAVKYKVDIKTAPLDRMCLEAKTPLKWIQFLLAQDFLWKCNTLDIKFLNYYFRVGPLYWKILVALKEDMCWF